MADPNIIDGDPMCPYLFRGGNNGGGWKGKWRWLRKHTKLLVSVASVSCGWFQLSCLVVSGVLMVVPLEYSGRTFAFLRSNDPLTNDPTTGGTFLYLVVVSAVLVVFAEHRVLVEPSRTLLVVCGLSINSFSNYAGPQRQALSTFQASSWFLSCKRKPTAVCSVGNKWGLYHHSRLPYSSVHSNVSICKINSLSVIIQSLGVTFNVVQAYLLWVLLRHARALTKQPLKTIFLTPTSKLPELIPGCSSSTIQPIRPFDHGNSAPLSPIYISGPEDIETGLLESMYSSRSSLSSSRYPDSSFSARSCSSGDAVTSSNSLRLPPLPLPLPLSTQPDHLTQPPPRTHASVKRELRRGREVF